MVPQNGILLAIWQEDAEHSGVGFVERSKILATQHVFSLEQNHLIEFSLFNDIFITLLLFCMVNRVVFFGVRLSSNIEAQYDLLHLPGCHLSVVIIILFLHGDLYVCNFTHEAGFHS